MEDQELAEKIKSDYSQFIEKHYVPRAEHEKLRKEFRKTYRAYDCKNTELIKLQKDYDSLKAVAERMGDELQRLKDVVGEVDIESIDEALEPYRTLTEPPRVNEGKEKA